MQEEYENNNDREDMLSALSSINEFPEPEQTDPSEKKERRHVRHTFGILQGDELADDFQQLVNFARYGLSNFHAAIIGSMSKGEIAAKSSKIVAKVFPYLPTSKSKRALSLYLRTYGILNAIYESGHDEQSVIQLILENPRIED